MNKRRAFLRTATIEVISAPLLSFDFKQDSSLNNLKRIFSDREVYWKMDRKQFPLKEGQTYFNNCTIGPISGYVIDQMIDPILHNNK